jgi:hypothetical protein
MAPIASPGAKEVEMSCWHGPNGCGPWHGYGYGWYDPADWYGEPDWPYRRTARRASRAVAAEDLEERLEALHAEIRNVERELAGLREREAPRE